MLGKGLVCPARLEQGLELEKKRKIKNKGGGWGVICAPNLFWYII